MLLSAVSVLVVAQSSSEIPEGLMNNPVFKLGLVDSPGYDGCKWASETASRVLCDCRALEEL